MPVTDKPFLLPQETAILALDGRYEGAEVEVRLSIGWPVYSAVRSWVERFAQVRDDGSDPAAVDAALRDVSALFIEHALVDWNLTDHSGPVPMTAEGFLALNDPRLMAALIGGWVGAVGKVTAPLEAGSPAGATP